VVPGEHNLDSSCLAALAQVVSSPAIPYRSGSEADCFSFPDNRHLLQNRQTPSFNGLPQFLQANVQKVP